MLLRSRQSLLCTPHSSVSSASNHSSPCSRDKYYEDDDKISELDKKPKECSKTTLEIVFDSSSSDNSDEESSQPTTIINRRLPSKRSNRQHRETAKKVFSYADDANESESFKVNCNESAKTNKSGSNNKLTKQPYKCQYKNCGRSYTTMCGFKQHQSIHTDIYRCRDCGRRCRTNAQLKRHQTFHKTIIDRLQKEERRIQFKCSIPNCGRRFFSRRGINRHQKQHEAVFECRDCGQSCSSKSRLIEHRRTHTGERPFKCRFKGCDKSYTIQHNLTVHEKVHTNEYQCQDCGKRCQSKNAFVKHRRTHLSYQFQCHFNGCDRTFRSDFNLSQHLAAHKRQSNKIKRTFKCLVTGCDRQFGSREWLIKHENKHKGLSKTFEKLPNNRLAKEKSLKNIMHQQLDSFSETSSSDSNENEMTSSQNNIQFPEISAKKLFKCNTIGCDFIFRNRGDLNRHKNMHTNKFKCSICGQRCQSKHHLVEHRRSHLSSKFHCHFDGCGRNFRSDFNLRQHIAGHKRQLNLIKNKFKCSVPDCRRQFGSKDSLKRHTNEHEVKFWCRECGRCCNSDAKLKQHQQEMHSSENTIEYNCESRKRLASFKKKQNQLERVNGKDNLSKGSLKTFKKLPNNRLAKEKALENLRQQLLLDSSSEDSLFDSNDSEMTSNKSQNKDKSDLVSDEDSRSDFSFEDSSTRDSEVVDNEVASNQSNISTVTLSRGPEMRSVYCQVNLNKEDASLKASLNKTTKKLFECRVKGCNRSFPSLFGLYKHKKEQHRRLQCRECRKRFNLG